MTSLLRRALTPVLALLLTMLACAIGLAPTAAADQCAPPGIDSASALPTNLAAAAQGPGADTYTTAGVQPLGSVDIGALRLATPGVLTVGTLSDAPPSICIDAAGQFTGFDNELLRAIAEKLGLRISFVGTDFSGLLAQVASGRFDVGSSSITTTDARRQTVGFTNGYDFGYFSLVVPTGSSITSFSELTEGQRIGVVQGTVQEAYVVDTLGLDPVKFPDYNTVYSSLKTRQIDAWVAPSQQAVGTVQPGDPATIIENTFSLDNFVAYAVAKRNTPLIDALNAGLDAGSPTAPGRGSTPSGCRGHCRRAGSRGPKPHRHRNFRTSRRSQRSAPPAPARMPRRHPGPSSASSRTRSWTGTSTGRPSPTCSRRACRTR